VSGRIIVHSPAQAHAAVAAAAALGLEVTLASAAGAGAYAGPAWFAALVEAAAAAFPGAVVAAVIDCADEPGTALAALRGGCRRLVFAGSEEARARLEEIAAVTGAVIESPGAPSLDLLDVRDPDAACRAFLANAKSSG
jgi:hypothetical protein